MQKLIIGSLVGGILLFFWQFLSWGVLDLHRPTSQHTVNQDSILTCLAKNIEPGFYFIPNTPPGVSSEEQQKFMESQAGKPWAQVYYHKSFNTSMSGNMIRGLLVNIVTIFLLCWILLQCKERNLKDTVLLSLSIGLIGYLTGTYTNSIWFEFPTMADLIDTVVGFGLVGLWLGYYLK
ncbi:MAG: hypothetical protein IPG18_14725 [Saprospiraceae bacterium]|nr:hypothetical protein [Saprospiraceae bacterium]MBK6783436.1 hypothetical protein [Saprospiraceae bacterium]